MSFTDKIRSARMGGTPEICQSAMLETLKELFCGRKYQGPAGLQEIGFYEQELPLPESTDYDADTEDAPAPFIIVRVESGKIPDDDSPQSVSMSIILCGYDNSTKRQGWRDVANMRERIIERFCKAPYFGDMFTVKKPILWANQQDETHPYYYGVITLTCTTPALTQDTELKELL